MKVTFQLTLDGLLRALRVKAHALADEIETQLPDEPAEIATEISRIREGERRKSRVGGD